MKYKEKKIKKMEETKLFVTTEDLLNKTLKYLGSKPYIEVAGLIKGLMAAAPYKTKIEENNGEAES